MAALMPEQQGTAAAFYNSREALRYSTCHQTSKLQEELTVAALQLLALPVSAYLVYAVNLPLPHQTHNFHFCTCRLLHNFCLTLVVAQA